MWLCALSTWKAVSLMCHKILMPIINGFTGLNCQDLHCTVCTWTLHYCTETHIFFPEKQKNTGKGSNIMNEFRIKNDALPSFMLFLHSNYGPSLDTDQNVCQRWAVQIVSATLWMLPRFTLSYRYSSRGNRGFLHVVKGSHITLKVTLTGFRAAGGLRNTQWQI